MLFLSLPGMLTAIEFDNQAPLNAAKIGKIPTNSMLSAEFAAGKALGSEVAPQFLLSAVESARSRRPRSRGLPSSGFIIARL